jgi:ferrous iron transport protein B
VLVIAGIIAGELLLAGFVLGRLLPGKTSDFMLELPPLRIPRARNIVLKTRARAMWFLKEALPFFIVATLILFALDRAGAMAAVQKVMEPVVTGVLGLPVDSATAFIVGFFRRDYGAAGLFSMWQQGMLNGNQIVIALVVMSLFVPCLATVIVTIKEVGLRRAMIIFFAVLAVSFITGGLLRLILDITGIML